VLGPAALVDAAAVIGSFQCMNVVADAAGIPLDTPMNAMSPDLQKDLGLRKFESSANSSKPNAVVSTVARWLRPLAFKLLGSKLLASKVRGESRPKGGADEGLQKAAE
jgi:ABC-type uncharacterized transport system auxiliary subunit